MIRQLLCMIVVFHVLALQAKTPQESPLKESPLIWKIEKNNQEAYIGGTIHILRQSDLPRLPSAYDRMYNKAEVMAFEVDMQEVNNPAYAQKMMSDALYKDGSSLKTRLSEENYQKLGDYLKKWSINIEQIKGFKPPMIGLMFYGMFQMDKTYIPGIDNIFSKKAIKDKKSSLALESIEEQLSILLHSEDGKENEEIEYLLRTMQGMGPVEFKAYISELINDIFQGDTDDILKELNKIKEYPQAYEALLVQRNKNWIPKIEKMMQTKEKEFILVGAMHLIGEDSVLALLKKKGYKITRLND